MNFFITLFLLLTFFCSCNKKTAVSDSKKSKVSDKKNIQDDDEPTCDDLSQIKLNLAGDIPCAKDQDNSIGKNVSLEKIIGDNDQIALDINMPNRSIDVVLLQLNICDENKDSCYKRNLEIPNTTLYLEDEGLKIISIKHCVRDCQKQAENLETLDGYACKDYSEEFFYHQDTNAEKLLELIKKKDQLKKEIISSLNKIWPHIKEYDSTYKKGECPDCTADFASIISHNVILGPEGVFYVLTDESYDSQVKEVFDLDKKSFSLAEDVLSCNISTKSKSSSSFEKNNESSSSSIFQRRDTTKSNKSSSFSKESDESKNPNHLLDPLLSKENNKAKNPNELNEESSSSYSDRFTSEDLKESSSNNSNKSSEKSTKDIVFGLTFFTVGSVVLLHQGYNIVFRDFLYQKIEDDIWDTLLKGNGDLATRMNKFSAKINEKSFKKIPKSKQKAFNDFYNEYKNYNSNKGAVEGRVEKYYKQSNKNKSATIDPTEKLFYDLDKKFLASQVNQDVVDQRELKNSLKGYDTDLKASSGSKHKSKFFKSKNLATRVFAVGIGLAFVVGGFTTMFLLSEMDPNEPAKIEKDLIKAIEEFGITMKGKIEEYKSYRDEINNFSK